MEWTRDDYVLIDARQRVDPHAVCRLLKVLTGRRIGRAMI